MMPGKSLEKKSPRCQHCNNKPITVSCEDCPLSYMCYSCDDKLHATEKKHRKKFVNYKEIIRLRES